MVPKGRILFWHKLSQAKGFGNLFASLEGIDCVGLLEAWNNIFSHLMLSDSL